jgi:hypothetical protein
LINATTSSQANRTVEVATGPVERILCGSNETLDEFSHRPLCGSERGTRQCHDSTLSSTLVSFCVGDSLTGNPSNLRGGIDELFVNEAHAFSNSCTASRWSWEGHVSGQVCNGFVTRVANSRPHRDLRLGNCSNDECVVKRSEVALRPSTSHNDNQIERWLNSAELG